MRIPTASRTQFFRLMRRNFITQEKESTHFRFFDSANAAPSGERVRWFVEIMCLSDANPLAARGLRFAIPTASTGEGLPNSTRR